MNIATVAALVVCRMRRREVIGMLASRVGINLYNLIQTTAIASIVDSGRRKGRQVRHQSIAEVKVVNIEHSPDPAAYSEV